MVDEILCDNCEALPATDFIEEGPRLCAACKDAYDEYQPTGLGDRMMLTRDWIQTINPMFNKPGKLLVRSVALLRAMWPTIPVEEWRLVAGSKIEGTIAVRVDPLISVRLIISWEATSAMIAIENPLPGMPIIGSIKRMALRNAEWTDILGWVNGAKTWYDRRDTEKLKACVQEGIVREEYLLSNPLNPPKPRASQYIEDGQGGVAIGSVGHHLHYEDEKGNKLSLKEVEELIKSGEAVMHKPSPFEPQKKEET